MTAVYTEFFDIIGANFGNVPLVPGTVRAVYLTGSGVVPETAAQLAQARAAGVGLIGIDQTPGLTLFRTGAVVNGVSARFGDIEYLAGTNVSADQAVAERQSLGLTEHGLYHSYDGLSDLAASIANPAGVEYWVADYAWSLAQAQADLAANAAWKAIQFGDPASNANTFVPGTSIPLKTAGADIDVASTAWLAQFLGALPTPVAPAPVTAPAWPFGPDDYLGTPRPSALCHSGYYSETDHKVVAQWQARMAFRGWTISADGEYGDNEPELNQGQSPTVAGLFQAQKGLKVDRLVGVETWTEAWTAAVTPG